MRMVRAGRREYSIDFQTVAAMFRAPGIVTVTVGDNTYTLHDKGRTKPSAN